MLRMHNAARQYIEVGVDRRCRFLRTHRFRLLVKRIGKVEQRRSVSGHSRDLWQYRQPICLQMVLHAPPWNPQIEPGTVAVALRPPRLSGIDQGGIPRFKQGSGVALAITPHPLKLRDDDASSILGVFTDHGKLGKGYRAGGKAREFEAGQNPALDRAMKGGRFGELKPAVSANLFCRPSPGFQSIRGGNQVCRKRVRHWLHRGFNLKDKCTLALHNGQETRKLARLCNYGG